jgi:hypothetical protein
VKNALLLAVLALAGCQGRVAHVFGGYAFEADAGDGGGCFETSGAIDVIDGPARTEPCKEVRCWVAPDGSVYVTDTACDAPADYHEGTDDPSGPCVKALASYASDAGVPKCPASANDGGS